MKHTPSILAAIALALPPLVWAQVDLGLSGALQQNTVSNPFAAQNMPQIPGADTAAKPVLPPPAQNKGKKAPF
jgi:hypothetical protein